jgi:hypothetical protein
MRRVACVWTLFNALCVVSSVSGQEKAGRLEGEKVSVDFQLLGTQTSGGMRYFAGLGVQGVDEKLGSWRIGAGAAGPKGCGGVASMAENPEQMLRSYPLVYAVDVKVIDAKLDEIHLVVDWKRYTRPSGARRPAAGDHLDVTLKEGERTVLDVIDRPEFLSGPCAARNSMLEMTPSILEDPALANRQIAYDLWLVDEQPNAKRATSAWKATGKQGQELTFQFPDRLLSPPGQAPGDAGPHLRASINGKIRGRLHQDGSLDLAVDVDQSLSRADRTAGTSGHEGTKRIRIQPGETIRIDIPLPQPPADRSGQTSGYQQCLQGHTLGLILTATPLQ